MGTIDERAFSSEEANQACYDLGSLDGALDHTGGNGGSGGNNENKKALLKFGLKSPHGTGFAQWANLNRFYVSCSALRRRQNQLSDCNLGKVDPKYAMVHGHRNYDLVIQCKSKLERTSCALKRGKIKTIFRYGPTFCKCVRIRSKRLFGPNPGPPWSNHGPLTSQDQRFG